MSERHPSGYLKKERKTIGYRDPDTRKKDFEEIYAPKWEEQELRDQGERCMDCGIPTCMGGCPLGNIIPDWNDLVYRDDWKEALERLHATNNFPEFTGYTCPAPCEDSCVLSYNDDPVAIKSIERAIVDKGWEMGWIVPETPEQRTGYKVAIIGSGPAGLAAAQQLNRVGHKVKVYERDDELGGLMMYGIPDFKFSKKQVARRIDQLRQEGIDFQTDTEVGNDITLDDLQDQYDAVCLAIGAQKHRQLRAEGKDLGGIHEAMEYLLKENKHQAGKKVDGYISAKDKNVVVLGGGDTGADCVATAHRQGAKSVVQISINPKEPGERQENDPWPSQPMTYKKTYAIEEGGEQKFSLNTLEFVDENDDGSVDYLLTEKVDWIRDENGRRVDKNVLEPDLKIPAELILIAIGFTGTQEGPFENQGLEMESGVFKTDDSMMTSREGIFASGDANMGQSLVVWAIGEGRDAARNIDQYLQGCTNLPASIRTTNEVINW